MTDPQSDLGGPPLPPEPPRRKAVTPAMLIAIAVVAVLAIAVVVVAVTRGNDEDEATETSSSAATTDSGSGGSDSEGSSSSESGASSDTETVTDSDVGLAYDYPIGTAPFEESKWSGPSSLSLASMPVTSHVGYESCVPEAGVDILFGFVSSSETDLAAAAQTTYTTASTNVVTDMVSTSNESGTSVTTDAGLSGELYEGDVTRAVADKCDNTSIHIVTLAVTNSDGQTQVLIGSYRTDGDTVASEQDLLDITITVFKSLRTA